MSKLKLYQTEARPPADVDDLVDAPDHIHYYVSYVAAFSKEQAGELLSGAFMRAGRFAVASSDITLAPASRDLEPLRDYLTDHQGDVLTTDKDHRFGVVLCEMKPGHDPRRIGEWGSRELPNGIAIQTVTLDGQTIDIAPPSGLHEYILRSRAAEEAERIAAIPGKAFEMIRAGGKAKVDAAAGILAELDDAVLLDVLLLATRFQAAVVDALEDKD